LSTANSYNGPTTVRNNGTLRLGNSNVLPTSPQTALTVNTNSTFDLASYSDGVASLAGDNTASVRNSVAGGTSLLTITPSSGVTTTFAGVIAGTNGGAQGDITLQKNGQGALILTGTNTYSGTTTVNGGTLIAAAVSGGAVGSTSAVTVNSGGTFMLGANDQINNAATVFLGGGTFAKGDFSEGSATAPGAGSLSLTSGDSHIDFGLGAVGTLSFTSFDPGFDFFTINIDNWTGAPGMIGDETTDRLIFASSQSDNLASFVFAGYAGGAMQLDIGGGFYEVVPAVPEASTYAAGILALLLIPFHHRKQLRPIFQRVVRRT
jgi:autotransporter-associated beta strand protein